MKKIVIILLTVFLTDCIYAETIALLEPRVGDGSSIVSAMEKSMVRGELRKAIVNFSGYGAITRADIDQIMKDQNFHHACLVS